MRKDQITQQIPALTDAQILKQSSYSNTFLLKLPQSQNLQSTITNLQSHPLIEYAEPNYHYYTQGSPSLSVSLSPSLFLSSLPVSLSPSLLFSAVPTDPFFENQWGLRKCLFTALWDSTTGDSSLVIGVLDSGVDTLHPDLKNRIIQGYDFVNDDPEPYDDNGHGTQIAGVIGAETNNGSAIAGCDWQTKLLILKVLDIAGMGDAFDVAEAIYYAVSHNARIINMSFGGYDYSQLIADAVQYAYNSNCILVAAAGNDATSLPFYPASYPNVIGVSATKENDLIAEFSNWGDYIDFAAPGVSIYTTNKGGGIIIVSGTSYSCGFVSGTASLILARDSLLTNDRVCIKLTGIFMKDNHELHEWSNGTNEEKIIYKDLSFKIMEAVFEVHNVLGPGYSENIYEEALAKEFKDRKIRYEKQRLIEIHYKGEKIGECRLDMVVDDKIILEPKAVSELNTIFESQVISYLKATGMRLGLLINFGSERIEYKRIVK